MPRSSFDLSLLVSLKATGSFCPCLARTRRSRRPVTLTRRPIAGSPRPPARCRCCHCADDHCSAREVGVLPARRTVLFVVQRVRAGGIGRLGSLALLVLRTLVVVGAGLPGEQPGSSTHRGRGP